MIVCIVIMVHLFHYHENMLLCFISVLLFFKCDMLCLKYIFIKGVFPECFLFHNCFIFMKQNLHQFERKQVVLKKVMLSIFFTKNVNHSIML
jgi:predicted membrane protein